MELVSIIIPVYNTEKWIGDMIDSILDQTYPNWELIIVDDGSSDGSVRIVRTYEDSRIKLLFRNRLPKGAPTCRNIGLKNANGKYVVFIDSDDILLPHALEQRVKSIEENSGYDFAVGGCKAFVQGESIKEALGKNRYIYGSFKKDPLSLLLKSRYPYIVCTNLYRRESLIKNNIIWDEDVTVFQDFSYNLKVLLAGLTYNVVNPFCIDYAYRVGHSNTNISREFISQEKFQSTLLLMEKTLKNISQREDKSKRKSEFIGFIASYYLRLLTRGTQIQCASFIDFCKRYYGKYDILRLKLIEKVSKEVPQFKYKMDLLKLLVRVLFGIKLI